MDVRDWPMEMRRAATRIGVDDGVMQLHNSHMPRLLAGALHLSGRHEPLHAPDPAEPPFLSPSRAWIQSYD